ncbi:DUF3613 domain-containing protein [Paraburkholderia sp. ZP32-5]|uniref:DUF3613 domain-containing protein n=1 Tax=Paraburkholderia sp. ZP32-5 TaxID=2883245 RepID=UPI001F1F6AB1|nr:DUF3613 domain-containing protein [Paraburkholderia sp. ZP32-5]
MTDRTTIRGWRASMRYAGALMVFVAIAMSVAAPAAGQTATQPEVSPDSPTAQTAPLVQSTPRASEVGHSTLAWLELQRSNAQAAPALPMLGAQAGLAYRRYLESFKSRIPDLYGSTLNGSGNGGSGSTSGSGSGMGSGSSGWH